MTRLLLLFPLLVTITGCHIFEKDYMDRLGRLVEISEVMGSTGGESPATQPTPTTQPTSNPP